MEEKNSGKNKRNEKKIELAIIVMVVVFFVFLLGIGMGISIAPMIKGSDSASNTSLDDKGIVELNENDVKEYLKKIKYVNEYFVEGSSLDLKDISTSDLLYSSWQIAHEDKNADVDGDLSKEQMREYVSYIFGADYSYKDQDLDCFADDGVLFKFDGNTYHKEGVHGHGGKGSTSNKAYFVSATRDDKEGEIDIKVNVLYGETCAICSPTSNVYKLPGELLSQLEEGESFDDYYEKEKDQLPIFTYTFKKDSTGDYGFYSMKMN